MDRYKVCFGALNQEGLICWGLKDMWEFFRASISMCVKLREQHVQRVRRTRGKWIFEDLKGAQHACSVKRGSGQGRGGGYRQKPDPTGPG